MEVLTPHIGKTSTWITLALVFHRPAEQRLASGGVVLGVDPGTGAQVNVGTGNLTLSVAGLAVPGVGGDRGVGAVYSSLHTATGSADPTGLLGAGFRLTESPDARVVGYPDGSARYIDPVPADRVVPLRCQAWPPESMGRRVGDTRGYGCAEIS